jgi:cell division protein FtsW
VSAPHRMDRIFTYFQGDNTSLSDPNSYQIEHAKIAIGTGGLFGVGIGNSVQATGYLPEAINDSVFAIMGETFGFVGLFVILALFYSIAFANSKGYGSFNRYQAEIISCGGFWLVGVACYSKCSVNDWNFPLNRHHACHYLVLVEQVCCS